MQLDEELKDLAKILRRFFPCSTSDLEILIIILGSFDLLHWLSGRQSGLPLVSIYCSSNHQTGRFEMGSGMYINPSLPEESAGI